MNIFLIDDYEVKSEIFSSLPLFSALTTEQIRDVISIASIKIIKKNRVIFSEGESYTGFYVLLHGSVKVYKLSSDGKEMILHIIKPPETFGEIPLFEGGNYPVNSQTMSDSTVIFFPKRDFLKILSSNPQICMNMLAGFAHRLRKLTRKIEELTTKEVVNRFACYLIEEMKKGGTDKSDSPYVELNISKKNIASYIGTITETFSRVLKKLQDEEIIEVTGKRIYIKDYNKLKTLAEI